MKKIIIVFALISYSICFAQSFSCVKVYISNPYVERVYSAKPQLFNMDYVRSHYSTYIFSMEENYINNLYDSLESIQLTKVAQDSIIIPYGFSGTPNVYFEPLIVIDFIRDETVFTNEEVWTFSVNRYGYVCKTFETLGNLICYPDKRCRDFLKRCFPELIFFTNEAIISR